MNESKALLNELPSLEDSTAAFFSAQTAGSAPATLGAPEEDLGEAYLCKLLYQKSLAGGPS